MKGFAEDAIHVYTFRKAENMLIVFEAEKSRRKQTRKENIQ